MTDFEVNEIKPVDSNIYLTGKKAIVCKDHIGDANKAVKIVGVHTIENTEFPEIHIVKTLSRDGLLSSHLEDVLTLDADAEPTAESKKLITSGKLFDIISNLQEQIADLQDQLDDLRFATDGLQ